MKETIEQIIKHNTPEDATQKILKLVVKSDVSGSLLSEQNLERCANLYAEQENSAYTNDYYGYLNGARQMANALVTEIARRRDLIISEPNGIVRETMIANLLVDLQ